MLDEKQSALSLLLIYASQLKQAFLPYVAPVAEIAVQTMKLVYHVGSFVKYSAVNYVKVLEMLLFPWLQFFFAVPSITIKLQDSN